MNETKVIQHRVKSITGFPGTLVGVRIGDMICIGSSVCKLSEGDVYTKREGVVWATRRAKGLLSLNDKTYKESGVQSLFYQHDVDQFVNRCFRVFQDIPYSNYRW